MADDKRVDTDEIHWLERFAFLISIALLLIPLVVFLFYNISDRYFSDPDMRRWDRAFLDPDVMMPFGQVVALSAITSGLLRILGGLKNTPESKVRAIYLETLSALAGVATAIAALMILELKNGWVVLALLVSMGALIMAWVATVDWRTRISELRTWYLYLALALSALGLIGTIVGIAAIKVWCKECPSICDELQLTAVSSFLLLVTTPAVLGLRVLFLPKTQRSVSKARETETN